MELERHFFYIDIFSIIRNNIHPTIIDRGVSYYL